MRRQCVPGPTFSTPAQSARKIGTGDEAMTTPYYRMADTMVHVYSQQCGAENDNLIYRFSNPKWRRSALKEMIGNMMLNRGRKQRETN